MIITALILGFGFGLMVAAAVFALGSILAEVWVRDCSLRLMARLWPAFSARVRHDLALWDAYAKNNWQPPAGSRGA